MSTKPFYNHIAGLRGIAIILVILFHLNASCFPHGFFGVDIFLVVSGYLLFLSFIRSGQKLNLKDFITKKLLRIFPPMVFLVLAGMLVALYIQDFEDLIYTSRTGQHTLLCNVNGFLRRTQGDYFAPEALETPFLHMWYMSVTIHIYALFALGCVAYRFIPAKLARILLWVVGIASFGYCYSYHMSNLLQALHLPSWNQIEEISHYSTLPRLWEPLAGGAILLLPLTSSKAKATLLTLLGLAAALLPALYPGAAADYGVPAVVLGTMLIIRYMPESSLMPVLSNRILLWVGGISFSLYLVHMPVISFFRIWYQGISGWGDYAIILTLSLVLGWLFWFLVEKRKVNIFLTAGLFVLTLILCYAGKKTDGFKKYIHPEINALAATPYDWTSRCAAGTLANKLDNRSLIYLNGSDLSKPAPTPELFLQRMGHASQHPSVVLLGDSHAMMAHSGLSQLFQQIGISGAFLNNIVIPFWDKTYYLQNNNNYFTNQSKTEALMDWLEANPCITHVVIAQYWRLRLNEETFMHWDYSQEPMTPDLFYTSVRDFVKRIHAMNKKVILLAPGPELSASNPIKYVRNALRRGQSPIDTTPISCTRESSRELNKEIYKQLQRIEAEGICAVVDTAEGIPAGESFESYRDGVFLMKDYNHLTPEGSVYIFNRLRPQLEPLLRPAPEPQDTDAATRP